MASYIVDQNAPVLIRIYTGDVTSGGQDGTGISVERAMSNPISVVLDSAVGESKCIKCAIRCDEGFKTVGTTTVSFMRWDGSSYRVGGGATNRFKIALDNGYTEDNVDANANWVDSFDISSEITDRNILFWLKISSALNEDPVRDNTVALTVKGVVVAVD